MIARTYAKHKWQSDGPREGKGGLIYQDVCVRCGLIRKRYSYPGRPGDIWGTTYWTPGGVRVGRGRCNPYAVARIDVAYWGH